MFVYCGVTCGLQEYLIENPIEDKSNWPNNRLNQMNIIEDIPSERFILFDVELNELFGIETRQIGGFNWIIMKLNIDLVDLDSRFMIHLIISDYMLMCDVKSDHMLMSDVKLTAEINRFKNTYFILVCIFIFMTILIVVNNNIINEESFYFNHNLDHLIRN